jgi:hypothetical protein
MKTTPAVYACLVATVILMSASGLEPLDPGIGTEKGLKIQWMLPAGIAVDPRAPGGTSPCWRLSGVNPARTDRRRINT